jgi:hypothetical protein
LIDSSSLNNSKTYSAQQHNEAMLARVLIHGKHAGLLETSGTLAHKSSPKHSSSWQAVTSAQQCAMLLCSYTIPPGTCNTATAST